MTTPLSDEMILRWTHFWLEAAIFQGERLEALTKTHEEAGLKWGQLTHEERSAFFASNEMGWDRSKEEAEGYFFLCAVRKALRWLDRAPRRYPEVRGAREQFLRDFPHAVEMRDMIEHEDEYLSGKDADTYRGTYNGTETNAHSIVVHGDDYILGGRLSVPKAVVGLKKILPEVTAARLAQAKSDKAVPAPTKPIG